MLSVDVGVTYQGFVGDSPPSRCRSATSRRPRSTCSRRAARSLFAAIDACHVGNRLGDIGHAVQELVEARGFTVVRDLVGHGVGRSMHHEAPSVFNFGEAGRGTPLREGMVLAIEPMITAGAHDIRLDDDGWSIYTTDGSMAAHFEHTVAVTDDGPLDRSRATTAGRPSTSPCA